MVYKPSVFKPLKFYCIFVSLWEVEYCQGCIVSIWKDLYCQVCIDSLYSTWRRQLSLYWHGTVRVHCQSWKTGRIQADLYCQSLLKLWSTVSGILSVSGNRSYCQSLITKAILSFLNLWRSTVLALLPVSGI